MSFNGLSPQALASLFAAHPGYKSSYTAMSSEDKGDQKQLQIFRDLIASSFLTKNHVVAVSYSRKSMGQLGYGHYAPVVGFNKEADKVLVFESNSYRYPRE